MRVLELMRTHVIKTPPDATLREAIDMMDLYQVRELPVVDVDDRLIGIVTERDLAPTVLERAAADEPAHGSAAEPLASFAERTRARPVSDVMTTPVFAVEENADVSEAARLMMERRLKRLPVTAQGRLVGTVTRTDVCQAVLDGLVP